MMGKIPCTVGLSSSKWSINLLPANGDVLNLHQEASSLHFHNSSWTLLISHSRRG